MRGQQAEASDDDTQQNLLDQIDIKLVFSICITTGMVKLVISRMVQGRKGRRGLDFRQKDRLRLGGVYFDG